MVKWEKLYWVEYIADSDIRSTGRWDMDKPDFEEFIQRFETGDANKNYIFIAKDHEIFSLQKTMHIFIAKDHENYWIDLFMD